MGDPKSPDLPFVDAPSFKLKDPISFSSRGLDCGVFKMSNPIPFNSGLQLKKFASVTVETARLHQDMPEAAFIASSRPPKTPYTAEPLPLI